MAEKNAPANKAEGAAPVTRAATGGQAARTTRTSGDGAGGASRGATATDDAGTGTVGAPINSDPEAARGAAEGVPGARTSIQEGRLSSYKVLRRQDGTDEKGAPKTFEEGDTRKLAAGEAEALIRSGALKKG